jgi:nucleoside-diphosphate-sugar epimerase
MRALQAAGAPAVAVTRKEVDLLASGAAEQLSALLKSSDAVVAVAARAPCKDMAMMVDNMVMTRNMIDALVRTPVAHVVNISSDAVYADAPVPLREDTPAAPTSLHGAMHLARELAFSNSIKSPLVLLRPTLIYGADDPHNGYGPNRFRRLANGGNDIVLFGDGEERRDHVLIDDVAGVILRVLKWRSVGVLNIASGEVHSFRKLAELVIASSPCKVAIKSSPRNAPMPHGGYRPFDIAACHAAFPTFAYTTLAQGIAKAQGEMAQDHLAHCGMPQRDVAST